MTIEANGACGRRDVDGCVRVPSNGRSELIAGVDGRARVSGTDERLMVRALGLAARGAGYTNPNPLVGCVIVRDGRVIGEGWHERYGEAHAEVNALADCTRRGENPAGSTVYVTLEPCAHHGKQPPCADALLAASVARVAVGSRDPNPLVAGKGLARLEAAGIEVVRDVLREACDALNPVFLHFIQTGRPYVVAKWAMTADGRIACASGDSRWVTGEAARQDAHRLRHRLAAIMVGSGTVLADDPELTCRLAGGHQPLRVVCDTRLAIAEDARLVQTAGEAPLLVACGELPVGSPVACKAERLRAQGVEVASLPGPDGRVDLPALMGYLGERGIDSVLVEGGSRLHAALWEAGLVNEVVAYVAPKVVGGAAAPGPVAGAGARVMAEAWQLGRPSVDVVGDDVRIAWRAGASAAERAGACVALGPLGPLGSQPLGSQGSPAAEGLLGAGSPWVDACDRQGFSADKRAGE